MEDYQEFALKQENPDDFNTNFRAYLETDAVSRILSEELAGIKDKLSGVTITDDQIKEILTDLANGYGEYAKPIIWHSLIRFRQLFEVYFFRCRTEAALTVCGKDCGYKDAAGKSPE